jgi:deoxyribodipyrimidine photo-lyase
MKSLFIFRRDFRLNDNIALIECYKKSEQVIPIFIFTPEQIKNNEYFSSNSFQFMLESLENLNNELNNNHNSQIHYYYGDNITILNEILKNYNFDSIFFNKDYTVYSKNRDEKIVFFCKDNNKNCNIYEDYLLLPISNYLKDDGKPYEKYTPFKNNAKKKKVRLPNNYKFNENKFSKIEFIFDLKSLNKFYSVNKKILLHGGRDNALEILYSLKKFSNYNDNRNDLAKPTTHLSAYIKFGCISIREVYNTLYKLYGTEHGLIDQLYWREFYYYLAYYIPRVLQGKSLKEKYDKIIWENNPKIFDSWKNGVTGFPSVDSGMRELNETGYMHNRARLITSGILIKILNCDWRLGEKYFATQLIDYDPIVNNGNWQWSSGSGADSQPYFRIMSPWKQAIDNDPECLYIKKWIPELNNVPNKDILNWGNSFLKYKDKINYPSPIVDYDNMRKEIVKIYKDGLYDS